MSKELIDQIAGLIGHEMEPERAELKAAAVKTLIHGHYMEFVKWLVEDDEDLEELYRIWSTTKNN